MYPKITKNLFLGTLALAPFIFIPWFRDCAELPRNCFLQASINLILLFWLIEGTLKSKTLEVQIPTTIGPITIFLLWALMSVSYAINNWEVLYRWTTWFTAFITFFLVCNLFRVKKDILPLMTVLFFASTGIAVIGISQHLFGLDIIPQSVRPASTFVNRNMAVHIIILTLPLSLPLLFADNRRSFDYLIPLSLSLQSTYLIYTTTRSGWLAAICQIVFVLIVVWSKDKTHLQVSPRRKRGMLIGLLIFLSLISLGKSGEFSGLSLIHERLLHTRYQAQTGGAQIRWAYWANSMAMLQDHPILGVGLGNFKIHYPKYHEAVLPDVSFNESVQAADVHNDFIQLIVELGIIGLLLCLWAALKTFFTLKSRMGGEKRNEDFLLATGIVAGLVGVSVSMTFSFPLQLSLPPVITATYFALLHNLAKAHTSINFSRRAIIMPVICVGIWSIRTLSNQSGILQAEHFNTKSMRQALADDYSAAAETAQIAYKHSPLWHGSLYHIATAYLRSNTPASAIKPYEKYLESHPYDINALSGLGAAYAENKQYDLGEAYIRKSLELLANNWPAYNHLGNLFLKQEKYKEAISAFNSAIDKAPKNSRLWYNLGVTNAKAGNYNSAINHFREAERLEPGWSAPLDKIAILEKLN